jgi:adenylate kinase
MSNRHEVIYLTGPPAVGKTTLIARLRNAYPDVVTFVYSELLARHMSEGSKAKVSQKKLREQSAQIVTEKDIEAVDQFLIREVSRLRLRCHVVIDSHPVTKEGYGFRVTAFSIPMLRALMPTRICMLYANPRVIIKRIAKHSKGRPTVTKNEADLHCALQSNVAVCYGLQVGAPIYFFDVSRSVDVALAQLSAWF